MTPPDYVMPAEWEWHEATWLAWPHNEDHWPGNFTPIPKIYCEIIRHLASSEIVAVCVNDQKMEDASRWVLQEAGVTSERVRFHQIPTNASWSRDHGPIFVRDRSGKLVITDWIFNAWGQKYPPWDLDDAVPLRISELVDLPVVQPGIVLEGGSIDVNGKGTLLTTEQCLLNKNRNPHLSRDEIERHLHRYLGASNVLWLKEGIIGDDTDGHIDDIARFVYADTVVCALEENKSDENYEILKRNYEDLKRMRDQDGSILEVISIPMPSKVIYEDTRLPASYANFYIANRVVIVPLFRCKEDDQAMRILSELFQDREVVGIDCTELVWGLGTLHCSTQQQPGKRI